MSLDDFQAQLRGTLDQQFAALKQKYEDAIAEARQQAAADAERVLIEKLGRARAETERVIGERLEQARVEADTKLRTVAMELRAAAERDVAVKVERARAEFEQARADWETQLQAVAAAARAEGEQAAGEAAQQERAALEQKLEQAVAQAVDQAVAAARRSAELELESERRRGQSEVEAVRQAANTELEGERERANGANAELEAARQMANGANAELEAERQKANGAIAELETARQMANGANAELEAEREKAAAEIEAARQKAAADVQAVLQKTTAGVEGARQKWTAEAEAERARAQAEFDSLRERLEAEIAAARQAAANAKVAAPSAAVPVSAVPDAAFERILTAIQDIDAARTLGQTLESVMSHAGAITGRAAIFLINGDRLKAWNGTGIPDVDIRTVESSIGGRDLLARAIQSGKVISSSPSMPAPPFARLPPDRTGFAVPLMISGRAVAVLYADSGAKPLPAGAAAIVEALVRHTSASVALRTAMRTLEILGDGQPNGAAPGTGGAVDDDQAARRFARLLVSEIKLYNEAAVRAGREQRDLRQRLRAEIDRAQRLYEERVSSDLGGRQAYFQQELVQTLADGDPALLGNQ